MSLSKDDLVVNGVYRVEARNYAVAIWDGEKFLGPLKVDGHIELVPEWDYSEGYPRGTCTAARLMPPVNITQPYGTNTVNLLAILDYYILENGL